VDPGTVSNQLGLIYGRVRITHLAYKEGDDVDSGEEEGGNGDGDGDGEEGSPMLGENNSKSPEDLEDAFEEKVIEIVAKLGRNPVSRIFTNTYSFFWNFPKKTMPYDTPWVAFKNSSAEFLSWYQLPHNLPPYRYVGGQAGEGWRDDMFCYGLEGNTLPLGNWDPFGFQLVDRNMMRKYRESELKHGRLAMLACVGFIMQEFFHPLHSNIGGMAITHMAQLRHVSGDNSIFGLLSDTINSILPLDTLGISPAESIEGVIAEEVYPFVSLDYLFVVGILSAFELNALINNWTRWQAADYNHQFEHNMGVGNLKASYVNGNYNWDVLDLMPKGKRTKRRALEKELNHCRLAMVAIIGMITQEYFTGISVHESLLGLLTGGGDYIPAQVDAPSFLDNLFDIPHFFEQRMSQSGFAGGDAPLSISK
jgi:hypothetical protein